MRLEKDYRELCRDPAIPSANSIAWLSPVKKAGVQN